jgi:hypothetical protein
MANTIVKEVASLVKQNTVAARKISRLEAQIAKLQSKASGGKVVKQKVVKAEKVVRASKKTVAKKKAPAKKTVKKAVKKEAPKKVVAKKSATGNKELDLMLVKIKEATKTGAKKVVVYTTSKESHKPNIGSGGFGVDDLKPKIYEAYKHLLCKFDVKAKLINSGEMAVEWVVNIKK